jgi:hypothetical protein
MDQPREFWLTVMAERTAAPASNSQKTHPLFASRE